MELFARVGSSRLPSPVARFPPTNDRLRVLRSTGASILHAVRGAARACSIVTPEHSSRLFSPSYEISLCTFAHAKRFDSNLSLSEVFIRTDLPYSIDPRDSTYASLRILGLAKSCLFRIIAFARLKDPQLRTNVRIFASLYPAVLFVA